MSARDFAKHRITLKGIATLGMAIALRIEHQLTWAVIALTGMGLLTLTGGIVTARDQE